jgi:hypothetical protein
MNANKILSVDTFPCTYREFVEINFRDAKADEQCSIELIRAVSRLKVGEKIGEYQFDNAVEIVRLA